MLFGGVGSMLLNLSAGCVLAAVEPSTAALEGKLTDSPKQIVDEVWQTVNSEYATASFDREQWLALRAQLLERDYRDRADAYREIRRLLKSLADPYTRFLEPKDFQFLSEHTRGELVGVGLLLITQSAKVPTIVQVLEDSPAAMAGIQVQDELIAINGRATDKMDIAEVSRLIRGEAGTDVTLSVERAGRKLDFNLKRAPIELRVVSTALKEEGGRKLGYIRLQEFSERAPEKMERAIAALEAQGAEGLLLDLRSNPGGLVSAATRIAELFLSGGTIVRIDRRGGEEKIVARRTPRTRLPLIVLVDGSSASSAEILASALQENHRAVLVGARTLGKGVIQRVNPLSDGSGVNVTIAHYLTPLGHDIHKLGITPDVSVALPEELRRSFRAIQMTTEVDTQYRQAVLELIRLL